MHTQHCGYWCPGDKAPGHQYPQHSPNICCIKPVSDKKCDIHSKQHQKIKQNLEKKWPSCLRLTCICVGMIISDPPVGLRIMYHTLITGWSAQPMIYTLQHTVFYGPHSYLAHSLPYYGHEPYWLLLTCNYFSTSNEVFNFVLYSDCKQRLYHSGSSIIQDCQVCRNSQSDKSIVGKKEWGWGDGGGGGRVSGRFWGSKAPWINFLWGIF